MSSPGPVGAGGPQGGIPPPAPPDPGQSQADAQATLEQAWALYRARITRHNPRLLKLARDARHSVKNLMRSS